MIKAKTDRGNVALRELLHQIFPNEIIKKSDWDAFFIDNVRFEIFSRNHKGTHKTGVLMSKIRDDYTAVRRWEYFDNMFVIDDDELVKKFEELRKA